MKTSVSTLCSLKRTGVPVERSTRLSNIARTKVDYNFTGLRACIKAGQRSSSSSSRSLDTPFLNESPRALRNETGYLWNCFRDEFRFVIADLRPSRIRRDASLNGKYIFLNIVSHECRIRWSAIFRSELRSASLLNKYRFTLDENSWLLHECACLLPKGDI